jgi:hypothetical protein
MTADYSTPEFRRRFTEQARRAAANSDLIIAVSAFTAAQVESLLHVERAHRSLGGCVAEAKKYAPADSSV